ncbi:hypothetical protein [Corynebacterium sputi]|uniref:hypothetical protein n=1 Tax=Corynebacterium sputi TaxID=489915 RepID=UPI0004794DF6|nr:hypothetical protein [Corynebacterium sputi]
MTIAEPTPTVIATQVDPSSSGEILSTRAKQQANTAIVPAPEAWEPNFLSHTDIPANRTNSVTAASRLWLSIIVRATVTRAAGSMRHVVTKRPRAVLSFAIMTDINAMKLLRTSSSDATGVVRTSTRQMTADIATVAEAATALWSRTRLGSKAVT